MPTRGHRHAIILSCCALVAACLVPAVSALAGVASTAEERTGAETTPDPYERAIAMYRQGRFEEAAVILETGLRTAPRGEAGYRSLLGWCRFRLGDVEEALASFRRALALAPGDADALEGMARAAARLSRNDEAMQAVAQLARQHPEVDVGDVAEQVLARIGAVSDRRLSPGLAARGDGAPPVLVSRARGDYFEVKEGDGPFHPIFVKGINLGAALPGKYPSEFPREKSVYLGWLREMSAMGANVIRLYTLFPPAFYQALAEHDAALAAAGRSPLWLVQGVWTELPEDDAYDSPEFERQFLDEIDRVIDAVHGNIAVARRRGHAFGLYDTDVSAVTLCWILGREWEPYSVEAFDASRPHPASFDGRYFTLDAGTPTEAWFAMVLDHAAGHETESYGTQRPVAFTNWPTLDPLHHPTETTKAEEIAWLKKLGLPQEPGTLIQYDNDGVSIDANRIVPTSRMPAGTFASYHAYPYYPDFMNVDPGYLATRDAKGPNAYLGYLRDLKAHHGGMPLLIAEIGVPTSRGIAHHQPQGWHHGGHDEFEQGEIDARLMETIQEARGAGGILFAWLDEWFKKNWLVIAFEVPWENNKNWLNILDPEQNYGLTAFKPGADGWKITIDGDGSDWDGVAPIAGDGAGPIRSLRVTSDEAYLYLRLDVDRLDYHDTHYLVGIDTYGAAEGDHTMPFGLGLKTPTGMEFAVDLAGPLASRLLCDVPYDLYTNRFNRPWKSSPNDDGIFTDILAETSRRRVGRDGTIFPAVLYNRSPLRYGTMDPGSSRYDDLADWNDNRSEGFIELRLGWNLLNVTDPSTRQVLDDPVPPRGGAGHTTTDGFRFYVAAYRAGGSRVVATLPAAGADGRFAADDVPFYTWDGWEQPTWHTYLKKSYFILEDRLPALQPAEGAAR